MKIPEIGIYPMKNCPNGDTTLAETHQEADFYDVLVRFEGDDPIEEVEDIPDFKTAYEKAVQLQIKYPNSDIIEIV
jgi:hypothetical protein